MLNQGTTLEVKTSLTKSRDENAKRLHVDNKIGEKEFLKNKNSTPKTSEASDDGVKLAIRKNLEEEQILSSESSDSEIFSEEEGPFEKQEVVSM